jgi:hypothetical protein
VLGAWGTLVPPDDPVALARALPLARPVGTRGEAVARNRRAAVVDVWERLCREIAPRA